MIMSYIWTAMAAAAFLYGAARGTGAAVSSAAMEGAEAALKFTLSTGGAICLWCGVTEVMSRCGISEWISKLLHPVLSRLFTKAAKDRETMDALSANVSANLLGLGNAATPMGIKAARGMAARCGGVASNELCTLVVLNTASIQLLPTSAAAVRAACGASSPFDIIPAVWISSVISVAVGLTAARLFSRRG